jgi:hypothetical protein
MKYTYQSEYAETSIFSEYAETSIFKHFTYKETACRET